MNKETIVNYVMTTLHNTNPAILKQMLNELSGERYAQADWAEQDENSPSFIKNKPILNNGTTSGCEFVVSSGNLAIQSCDEESRIILPIDSSQLQETNNFATITLNSSYFADVNNAFQLGRTLFLLFENDTEDSLIQVFHMKKVGSTFTLYGRMMTSNTQEIIISALVSEI